MFREELERLARALAVDDIPALPERVTIPTNATSEFLANRAMGDWAEAQVRDLVARSGLVAVGYGDDNRMAAGEDGFEEMYLENRAAMRRLGKKPDVLVFSQETAADLDLPGDIRGLSEEQQDPIVRRALAGIEVRSSKFRAKKYHRIRREQVAAGEKVRRYQSFTPKVEDVPVILRWVRAFGIPHLYVQVFFDEVYAIRFDEILRVLDIRARTSFRGRQRPDRVEGYDVADIKDVVMQQPKNSNFKKTHMVPVRFGRLVAEIPEENWGLDQPGFELERRETDLGRIDAFLRPVGGNFRLVNNEFRELIEGARIVTGAQQRLV